jgi:hypothetical protein
MYTLSIHTIDILVFSSYHENEHLFTWAAFSFNFRAMRALILAPTNPTLPDVAAEAAAVANAHPGSRLLQGAISEGDIAQAVAPGGFDLFWLATHGNRDGVLLTRETLAASALITYVAASGACTVMLNTCDSIHLAAQIVDSTPASVVATIQDLPDSDAARTGALFAAQLAAHSDPRTAYERSKPGKNRTYVYLANARPTTPAPKATPKKRGAQTRNKNALKHGFYSRVFDGDEIADLETLMSAGIDDEIYAMRVHFRRVLDLARQQDIGYDEAAGLLDTMSRASTTLATLLRTKKLISPQAGNDTARAITDALTAVARELQL